MIPNNPTGGGGQLDKLLNSVQSALEPSAIRSYPQYLKIVGDGAALISNGTGFLVLKDCVYTKIYTTANLYNVFQTVPGGCLVSGSGSPGLFFYRNADGVIVPLTTVGIWDIFFPLDRGCLAWCSTNNTQGMYYFDFETQEATVLTTVGYNFKAYLLTPIGFLFLNPGVSGLYLVDTAAKPAALVKLDAAYYNYLYPMDGYCVLSRPGSGIWALDYTTRALTCIFANSRSFANSTPTNFGRLICADVTFGVMYLDGGSRAVTPLLSGDTFVNVGATTKHGCLATGHVYNLYYFRDADKSFKQLIGSGGWSRFFGVPGGYIITNTGSYAGIYFFDEEAETCTQVYVYETGWDSVKVFDEGCLITGPGTQTAIVWFSFATRKCTAVGGSMAGGNGYWKIFHPVPGGCILGTTSNSYSAALLLFKFSTQKCKQIYLYGANWAYGTDMGDHLLIAGGDYSNVVLLVYDYATETISEVGVSNVGALGQISKIGVNWLVTSVSNGSYQDALVYSPRRRTAMSLAFALVVAVKGVPDLYLNTVYAPKGGQ